MLALDFEVGDKNPAIVKRQIDSLRKRFRVSSHGDVDTPSVRIVACAAAMRVSRQELADQREKLLG